MIGLFGNYTVVQGVPMENKRMSNLEQRQLQGLIKELETRVESGRLGLELVLLQLEDITQTSRVLQEPALDTEYPRAS